jgi:hypothetical protein
LKLPSIDTDERGDLGQSLAPLPHLLDGSLQAGEVTRPPASPLSADLLLRLIEPLPFPFVDSIDSVQRESDRCGGIGIGASTPSPLLVHPPLRFTGSVPSPKLLVRVHT